MSAEAGKAADRKKPRTLTGVVTSDSMDKTRTVTIQRLVKHPLYKKYIRRRTTYKVHDENNTSQSGDTVLIAQTRPLSKTKSWRLVEVVTKRKG